MLPENTLTSVHNQPDGTKKAKDRVTINACANASGTLIKRANTRVVSVTLYYLHL